MGAMASQITSLTNVYSAVYSGADQRKTSKLRATGLFAGNSPVIGEFHEQMVSNAENASIWWRHHVSVLFFISDICRGLQNGENVKHVKMLTHGQNDGLSRQLYSPAMGTVNSSLHSLADSIRNVEQNCRLLIQVGNERFFLFRHEVDFITWPCGFCWEMGKIFCVMLLQASGRWKTLRTGSGVTKSPFVNFAALGIYMIFQIIYIR